MKKDIEHRSWKFHMPFENKFSGREYKHGATTLENGVTVSYTLKYASTMWRDNSRCLPERNESVRQDEADIWMFTAALLIVTPNREPPKYQQVKRHALVYPYFKTRRKDK